MPSDISLRQIVREPWTQVGKLQPLQNCLSWTGRTILNIQCRQLIQEAIAAIKLNHFSRKPNCVQGNLFLKEHILCNKLCEYNLIKIWRQYCNIKSKFFLAAGCRLIKVVSGNWWIPVGMRDATLVCSETKHALFVFRQQVIQIIYLWIYNSSVKSIYACVCVYTSNLYQNMTKTIFATKYLGTNKIKYVYVRETYY